jgi:hypothetical protein
MIFRSVTANPCGSSGSFECRHPCQERQALRDLVSRVFSAPPSLFSPVDLQTSDCDKSQTQGTHGTGRFSPRTIICLSSRGSRSAYVAYEHQLYVCAVPILDSIKRYLGHNGPGSALVLDVLNGLDGSKGVSNHFLKERSALTDDHPLIAPRAATLLECSAL